MLFLDESVLDVSVSVKNTFNETVLWMKRFRTKVHSDTRRDLDRRDGFRDHIAFDWLVERSVKTGRGMWWRRCRSKTTKKRNHDMPCMARC